MSSDRIVLVDGAKMRITFCFNRRVPVMIINGSDFVRRKLEDHEPSDE